MDVAEFLLTKAFGSIVVPPGANIVLALLALVLLPFARRLAALVVLVAAGSLYAFSTGVVAGALVRSLHEHPALPAGAELSTAEVIVVLGGGGHPRLLDHEGLETAGGSTLERLRYAASLHRRTGLPLLVTGGSPVSGIPPLAERMARSLKTDFGIDVRFVESRSRNTAENATRSAALLAEAGIAGIVLVTHATHMFRAAGAFESQGLKVVPAPIVAGAAPVGITAFLPRAGALAASVSALHEYIGRLWYQMRY